MIGARTPLDKQFKARCAVTNMRDGDMQAILLKNFIRLDTLEEIREDVLELTRVTQHLQSQARPMGLGPPPGKGSKRGRDRDRGGRGDQPCLHCGKSGHVQTDCRVRIAGETSGNAGGPRGRGGRQDPGQGSPTCGKCKSSRHVEADCKSK
jgi:hypothetical protein